jgi:hypothetical protein
MVGRRGVKRVKGECEGEYQQNYQQQQENVIMPPPHLNLSNSAYFPGLGLTLAGGNVQNGVMPHNAMGYFSNNPYQYHPQHQQFMPSSQQQQQMTYNYNMNFFWPAYFNAQQHSYGMMNNNAWFNNGSTLDFLPQNIAMNAYGQQQLEHQYQ